MKLRFKSALLLLASSTILFVSCGSNLTFYGKFNDVAHKSENDYALRLTPKSKNMSYEQFKNRFYEFYNDKKNENSRDYPNACEQGAISKCLDENRINHLVILQLINNKTLEFISKKGLPIPWENENNTYFDWILNWDDTKKVLSGKLQFGHFHGAQKHEAGSQDFSIKFEK